MAKNRTLGPQGIPVPSARSAGRPFDLSRFQQEVATEIGIDLAQLATKQGQYRSLEQSTHSDSQRPD